jgi:hypothetical protein
LLLLLLLAHPLLVGAQLMLQLPLIVGLLLVLLVGAQLMLQLPLFIASRLGDALFKVFVPIF